MTVTFNRRPLSVNVPNKKKVANKFFNTYQWKGLIDDQNYMAVDQNSFSDCNNVYVDTEGVLKSRPSLKAKTIVVQLAGGQTTLAEIVDVQVFNTVTVYESRTLRVAPNEYTHYLTFVQEGVTNATQMTLSYTDSESVVHYFDKINLVISDEKIFIFSEHRFDYYDIVTKEIYTATTTVKSEDKIYIPITKIVTNGIETKGESANALTTSYITNYIMKSYSSPDFNILDDKLVTIKIGDQTYENITFKKNQEILLVSPLCSIGNDSIADEHILGYGGAIYNSEEQTYKDGIPLIKTTEKGQILLCVYNDYTLIAPQYIPDIHWTVYYSANGVVFTILPNLDNIIGVPTISKNGTYAIAFKKDGPYIYSLLAEEATGNDENATSVYKYTSWTNLINSLQSTESTGLDLNEIKPSSMNQLFNQSTTVNGYFIDDTNWSFVYGSNVASYANILFYNKLHLVSCSNCTGTVVIKQQQIAGNLPSGGTITVPSTSPVKSNPTVTQGSISIAGGLWTGTVLDYGDFNIEADCSYTGIGSGKLIFSFKKFKRIITSGTSAVKFNLSVYITDSSNNIKYIIYQSGGSARHWEDSTYVYDYYDYDYMSGFDADITHQLNPWLSITPSSDITTYSITFTISNIAPSVMYVPIHFASDIRDKGGNFLENTSTITNATPNVYCNINKTDKILKTIICYNFDVNLTNGAQRTIEIDNDFENNTFTQFVLDDNHFDYGFVRHCLRNDLYCNDNISFVGECTRNNANQSDIILSVVYVDFDNYSSDIGWRVRKLKTINDLNSRVVRISKPSCYILTNDCMYPYTEYTRKIYTSVDTLFNGMPVDIYYSGNYKDNVYIYKDNFLYSLYNYNANIEVLSQGVINYTLFDHITQLEDFYFSKDKDLFISQNVDSEDFKWYLPEKRKQSFDYNITNLHPISSTEVAIFLPNEVRYSHWDSDNSLFRYYKSKLQVGCKEGSDVLTTFDGKYVIFPSERGLVAMSYQQFVATDEQTLTYLSDGIYSIFYDYLNENNSLNQIKLAKFSYYVFVYKQDTKHGFIFDTRTNSWWKVSNFGNNTKLLDMKNELKVLSGCKLYDLNKTENYYYDYNGTTQKKINWYIISQKLYLGAINYYKSVLGLTFDSTHNIETLNKSIQNVSNCTYNLQVNNYRKSLNGNISKETFTNDMETFEYTAEIARSFVKRVHYPMVNLFQYKLYNHNAELDLPLSLSGLTVKYKIGGEIR